MSFKQYNPNKPAKYGMLFKSINAARFPYTFVTAPYAGKPNKEESEYYQPDTETVTKYLVNRLNQAQTLQRRNLSFDRLYTSLSLADWLFDDMKMTCIGTLQ